MTWDRRTNVTGSDGLGRGGGALFDCSPDSGMPCRNGIMGDGASESFHAAATWSVLDLRYSRSSHLGKPRCQKLFGRGPCSERGVALPRSQGCYFGPLAAEVRPLHIQGTSTPRSPWYRTASLLRRYRYEADVILLPKRSPFGVTTNYRTTPLLEQPRVWHTTE